MDKAQYCSAGGANHQLRPYLSDQCMDNHVSICKKTMVKATETGAPPPHQDYRKKLISVDQC